MDKDGIVPNKRFFLDALGAVASLPANSESANAATDSKTANSESANAATDSNTSNSKSANAATDSNNPQEFSKLATHVKNILAHQ